MRLHCVECMGLEEKVAGTLRLEVEVITLFESAFLRRCWQGPHNLNNAQPLATSLLRWAHAPLCFLVLLILSIELTS